MKSGPQRRGPAKAQAGQSPNEQRRRDRGEQHMMSHAHGEERGGQRAERRDEEEDENRETGPKGRRDLHTLPGDKRHRSESQQEDGIAVPAREPVARDRKSTRLKLQSLMRISYAVFCLKQKT